MHPRQQTCRSRAPFYLCALLAFGSGSVPEVYAQSHQFVLVDAVFTAATNNTMSSEYALAPREGVPSNWRVPIDYASGSIHVRTQVLEKPSNMPTLTNVCFKEADVLTCMPYPPAYSKPGVYESEPEFSKFWQYEMYDWTKMIERVNVVVKDEGGRFVQGNSAYFPTKLHVTVTVIPPGESYIEPEGLRDPDSDAGVVGLPGEPATSNNTTANPGAAGGASVPPFSGRSSAGSASAGALSAGHAAPVLTPHDAGAPHDIRDFIDSGGSCAVVVIQARPKARYGVAVSFGGVALSLWQIARMGLRVRKKMSRVRSRRRHLRQT